MHYLPTAFAQLFFSWKLYHYALEGKIDREGLDSEITFKSEDQSQIFVLPARIFDNENDFILAFENNLTIAFGAAAITLDRARYEAGYDLPNPIRSENDQCIALCYQIRCAFAHDIAEPRWKIKERYRRTYEFGGIQIDLTNLDGAVFGYHQIGGPGRLIAIKDYAVVNDLVGKRVR
ncbi:hypothetical protein [Breoghania sp. L-A4]|uniref:hypothetical protein n=1 Tax=Breoghania sp. L-A4 TaxID=2304600 RepID=UPI000E360A0C|nr:hypothetical protein [Breoghania sp. L-A4]AXS39732.1 hypothetical protein D1F64_06300 [Breoghania sp. L-A4]